MLEVLEVSPDPNGPILYRDHSGEALEHVWHVAVRNSGTNLARNLTCFLLDAHIVMGYPFMEKSPTWERPPSAPLKWALIYQGYDAHLAPGALGKIDLFALQGHRPGVFLHSLNDFTPRKPIAEGDGVYRLSYAIYRGQENVAAFDVEVEYAWSEAPRPPQSNSDFPKDEVRAAWKQWEADVKKWSTPTTARLVNRA